MGKRIRGGTRAAAVALVIAIALVGSAFLAFATTAPNGSGGSGGVTTTTTCRPGYGFGDQNHCHTGPPGLQKK